jgi:4-hydroxy-3-methylbut-2-enyl diphosphate reductase
MQGKITLAKTAGFCFGVNRAVSMLYDLISKDERICTLGPIIHNPQVIEDLESKGVTILDDINNATSDKKVVIRTHGVTKQTEARLRATCCEIVDATCPFVKRIHKIVEENSKDCDRLIIVGDKNHPEVVGINSYANSDSVICSDDKECSEFVNKQPQKKDEKILLVSQTTGNNEKYVNCQKIIKKVYTKAKIFDTICSVTENRQNEVKNMAMSTNLMCVIGCTKSSNTKKLYEIASMYCRNVFLLETADELDCDVLKRLYFEHESTYCGQKDFTVGITAGASTPDDIIEEVKVRVEKILL